MRDVVASTVLAVAVGFASPAAAGSLDGFTDSYNETQSQNQSDDSEESERNGSEDSGTTVDLNCEEQFPSEREPRPVAPPTDSSEERVPGIVRVLIGATPGSRFSLGASPYDGRGWKASGDLSGAAVANRASPGPQPRTAFDGRVTDHSYQWRLRSSALLGRRGDAVGGEVAADLRSSKMPGFAFSYQYARQLQSPTNLGLGYLAYRPNIVLSNRFMVTWNLGLSFIHSNNGVGNFGATAGTALETYPIEPLLFAGRANLHGLPGVLMGDLRGTAGVFVGDHVAIEGHVRHLQIFGAAGMTTFGLGVRSYIGL